MITTQYSITLPSDYDMNIIRERVRNNGHKTDGFDDLKFKLYCITEKGKHRNVQNSYCPLYFWKSHSGLNTFLFEGFYDNILRSFGWQQVNVGIPLIDTTTYMNVRESHFLYHITKEILPQESLIHIKEQMIKEMLDLNQRAHLVVYNPEKWKVDVYYFLKDAAELQDMNGITYSILYVSQETTENVQK